jgi:hypothetical protein
MYPYFLGCCLDIPKSESWQSCEACKQAPGKQQGLQKTDTRNITNASKTTPPSAIIMFGLHDLPAYLHPAKRER